MEDRQRKAIRELLKNLKSNETQKKRTYRAKVGGEWYSNLEEFIEAVKTNKGDTELKIATLEEYLVILKEDFERDEVTLDIAREKERELLAAKRALKIEIKQADKTQKLLIERKTEISRLKGAIRRLEEELGLEGTNV